VYVFQSKYYSKASSEFLKVSQDYSQLHHQLEELKNQRNIEVMKGCDIIGMTVTGAAMRANLLADIKPSVMIVEEAAEILEGQLVAVIPPSVQHLIMIGDHKQLKPVVHFHRLKKHHNLDLSMFERLLNCNLPFRQLGFQCRMRDEFVDLLRELKIYKELKTNYELVRDNDPPSCVSSSMYFWTHTVWESEPKGHSKRNSREAREITEVAKTFCKEGGVPPSKITVLCSYRGQVQEIRNWFLSAKLPALEDITVTTIDSFQGQENDIILLSLVRSNNLTQGKIGYLSSMNRLCVAISRARCGLYLFGNHTHLASASKKGWKVVSDSMRKKGHLGPKFPFCLREDSNPLGHSESQFDGSSPSRETERKSATGNVYNIHAYQANVNVGGDSSVNTINTKQEAKPSNTTLPPPLHMPSPESWSMPQSPPPEYPGGSIPTQEVGSPTKEARLPIEEAGAPTEEVVTPTKEVGLSTQEAATPTKEMGSPTQEAGTPTKEANLPTQEEGTPTTQEVGIPTKEARLPTQEKESHMQEANVPTQEEGTPIQLAGLPTQEMETPTNEANIPTQEEGPPTKESTQEASTPTEETRSPTLEEESPAQGTHDIQDFEGFDKERPVQETESPHKGVDLSEGKPLQETGGSEIGAENSKEDPVPTQETMAAGKGPFEETGQDEEKALEETEMPSKTQGVEGDETKEKEFLPEDISGEKNSLQETRSPEVDTKNEALPTQETMAAGKGPFEETGLEVGVKGHPTDELE